MWTEEAPGAGSCGYKEHEVLGPQPTEPRKWEEGEKEMWVSSPQEVPEILPSSLMAESLGTCCWEV